MGAVEKPPLARTVILDYYDSYTNNILALLTRLYTDAEVLSKVVVIKHDHFAWDQFKWDVLPHIDCVILSPGPGRPDHPADIGFGLDLLRLDPTPVPILGVCLGHQSIAYAFGGKIVNTPRITHGHVIPVRPVRPLRGLFGHPAWEEQLGDAGTFDVTVYNSLTVDPDSLPDELEVTAWSAPVHGEQPTIQGLRHKIRPIWGVQYHPESICSTLGPPLFLSFFSSVHAFHRSPLSFPRLKENIRSACAYAAAAAPTSRAGSRAGSRMGSRPGTPGIAGSGGAGRGSACLAGLLVGRLGDHVLHSPTSPSSIAGPSSPYESRTNGPAVAGDPTGGAQGPKMESRTRHFGELGKGKSTEEVFRGLVWPRRDSAAVGPKGKGRAVQGNAVVEFPDQVDETDTAIGGGLGAVWLDGENPNFPSTSTLALPSFVITYSLSSRLIRLYLPASFPSPHTFAASSSTPLPPETGDNDHAAFSSSAHAHSGLTPSASAESSSASVDPDQIDRGKSTLVHVLRLGEDQTFWGWFAELQREIEELFHSATSSSSVVSPHAGDASSTTHAGAPFSAVQANGVSTALPSSSYTRHGGERAAERHEAREKGWKGGWMGWMGYEMGKESLEGYAKSPGLHDDPAPASLEEKIEEKEKRQEKEDEREEETDACWAWCPLVLERAESGVWIARGLVQSDEQDSRSDLDGPVGGDVQLLQQQQRQTSVRSSCSPVGATHPGMAPETKQPLRVQVHGTNQIPSASTAPRSASFDPPESENHLSALDTLLPFLIPSGSTHSLPSALHLTPASFSAACSSISSFFESPDFPPAAQAGGTALPLDLHPICSPAGYMAQVDQCREWIRQGETYELTLTTEFRGKVVPSQVAGSAYGETNGDGNGGGDIANTQNSYGQDLSTRSATATQPSEETSPFSVTRPAASLPIILPSHAIPAASASSRIANDQDVLATYLSLRARNPAHYSTFISLPFLRTPRGHGVHILSSSPERFLRITNEHVTVQSQNTPDGLNDIEASLRQQSLKEPPEPLLATREQYLMNNSGGLPGYGPERECLRSGGTRLRRVVEMKPIKGTRKRPLKGVCICPPPLPNQEIGDGLQREKMRGCGGLAPGGEACEAWRREQDRIAGEELVADGKERAENLMIVDLIRSDLLTSCPPSSVTVPKLIALESHGVHHLVTTVRGELSDGVGTVDVLGRCFPPGSMTGAPKLRSVQLLSSLESRRRGLYSGCLGYISACDGTADLSVVIRTLVIEGTQITLGAGGAVTWLSDRQKEWEEVGVKVGSVLGHRVPSLVVPGLA